MRFVVSNSYPSNLIGYEETVWLVNDNWDDWFKFETKYFMYYIDNAQKIEIGSVKIGQFNMSDDQRRALLPNQFTALPIMRQIVVYKCCGNKWTNYPTK